MLFRKTRVKHSYSSWGWQQRARWVGWVQSSPTSWGFTGLSYRNPSLGHHLRVTVTFHRGPASGTAPSHLCKLSLNPRSKDWLKDHHTTVTGTKQTFADCFYILWVWGFFKL